VSCTASDRVRMGCRPTVLLIWIVALNSVARGEVAPVTITGAHVVPAEALQAAAGTPPADEAAIRSWASGAIRRILAMYHDRGHSYARAWFARLRGKWRIHVDEGQMRILFTGAGAVTALLLQVDLNLPHNVFHGPTLDRALEELKSKHDLLNVYYRVKEPGEVRITPFGRAVPQRVLQIYIIRGEGYGWGFDVSVSATWGLLPGVEYNRKGLLWSDDLLDIQVEVAFPFRRYLFDKDPKFTWVRGSLECAYRLPRWFKRHVGLRPMTDFESSRYERTDLGLLTFYELRSTTVVELGAYFGPVEFGLGSGVDSVWIRGVDPLTQPAGVTPPPEESSLVRSLWRTYFRLRPNAEVLRRDQRSYLNVVLDLLTATYHDHMFDVDLSSQLFVLLGRHRLIGRLQGRLIAGSEVPFFDEASLAGDHQRVFFGDRYWVHEALQLEVAYRVNLFWDWFEAGVFHDLSLFGDRSDGGRDVALANAFGPSFHFLLIDTFSLSIYSGFGFAPVGFDHTFSFNIQGIF